MNKEQTTLLHEIHAMVREQRVDLAHVKEQTTKTNGRVNKHDAEIDMLKTFQTKAMLVWGVALTIVVFVANKFI